jgi:hypothetical protein
MLLDTARGPLPPHLFCKNREREKANLVLIPAKVCIIFTARMSYTAI